MESVDNNNANNNTLFQDMFLKTIAHEIRTPLNVIVGCCDVLSQPDCDNETRSMLVAQLKRSVIQLINFYDNAEILCQLEDGKISIRPSKFDLNFAFDFIYNSTKSLFMDNDKKYNVSYVYNKNLPKQPIFVESDDGLICRAISLLIDNAVKFTESGTVTLSVSIEDDENSPCRNLVVEVSDTGIGIPKDEMENVFKKYWKSPIKNTMIYSGAGLGLPIVRKIVDMLNGKINMYSEYNVGTTFNVTIPINITNF